MRADPKTFFWIDVSVSDAAAVNPNGIKTLLANDLSTFLIKGKSAFSDSPRSLRKNPPNRTTLDSSAFENFILADNPFAKALRILETCIS